MFKKTIVALLAVVAILNVQSVSALGLNYGVGAGANISSVKSFSDDVNLGTGWGFQVGAHAGIDLAIVSITAEMWYTKGSTTYDAQTISGDFGNLKLESLDVPVIASISVFGPLKLKVGPSFALWSRATLPGGEEYFNIKDSCGYVAGIGLDFLSIGIDVRYNGQFSSSILPTGVSLDGGNKNLNNYGIRADSFSIVMTYSF